MVGIQQGVPSGAARVLLCVCFLAAAACGGGGSSPAPNQLPSASAGADQTVLEGSSVTLSGSGSADSDGAVSRFAWAQTGGPGVSLGGASSVAPTFTAPLTDSQLTLTFELTVTDDRGGRASDTTSVVVDPSEPPTADAGADQTVAERQDVALSASGSSDPDGTIASYSWTQTGGPAVTLSDSSAVDPAFTAPATDGPVDLTFEVTVSDSTEDVASDDVTVTVEPYQLPQVAATYPCDGCRFQGDSMTVVGWAAPGNDTPDGDPVSVLVDAGAGSVAATMLADEGWWFAPGVPVDPNQTNLTVTVTVTDQFGEDTQLALQLEQRPTLTGGVIAPDPVRADVVYLLETSNPRARLLELRPAADDVRVLHEWDVSFNAFSLVPDPAGNRLLTAVANEDLILDIDLPTGTATTFSGDGTGSGPAFSTPWTMAMDNDADRLIVADFELEALLAVDLTSGERTIVADNAGVGTGPSFDEPATVAVDAATQKAYVAQVPGTVLEVDLDTGNRLALSPSQALPDVLSSLAFDADRGNLIVWSFASDALFSVEPASGHTTELSAPDTSGISAGNGVQVRVDPVGDRYLVNDLSQNFGSNDSDAVIGIDPNTGAREILYQDTTGTGPRLDDVRNLALDPFANVAYVLDESSLYRIELSGGGRTLVSGPDRGTGDEFTDAVDLALDLASNHAYVLDRGTPSGAVIAVNLTTGDRSLTSGPLHGEGPDMPEVTAIVLVAAEDPLENRLLVADDALDALVSISVATGERAIFSAAADGLEPFVAPWGMDLDVGGNRVIVADEGSGATASIRIFGVDLTTGEREVISDAHIGSGHPLSAAADVAAMDGADLWIVAAYDSLIAIDGMTGERALLASDEVGTGESVANIRKIAVDPLRPVVYGWSANFEALFQFDVLTGSRVVVSK